MGPATIPDVSPSVQYQVYMYKRLGPATIPDVSSCVKYQGYIRGWILQLSCSGFMCVVFGVYKRVGPGTIPGLQGYIRG